MKPAVLVDTSSLPLFLSTTMLRTRVGLTEKQIVVLKTRALDAGVLVRPPGQTRVMVPRSELERFLADGAVRRVQEAPAA